MMQQLVDFIDAHFLELFFIVVLPIMGGVSYFLYRTATHADDPLWNEMLTMEHQYDHFEREYLGMVDTLNSIRKAGEPDAWYKKETERLRALRDEAFQEYQEARAEWLAAYQAKQAKTQGG